MIFTNHSYIWLNLLTGILFGCFLLTFPDKSVAQHSDPVWVPFETALELADQQNKPILVDVWAPWCGWCKKMERDVYPELLDELSDKFILTRLNRDDNARKLQFGEKNLTPLRIAQQLQVQTVPGIVFLSAEGDYLAHLTGYVPPETLRSVIQ